MRKLPYSFTVSAVTNGYTVQVGCMTLVFNDPAVLQVEIGRYLANPAEVITEYEKRYGLPLAARDADAGCEAIGDMGVAGTSAELRDWRETAAPVRVSDPRNSHIDSEYVRGLEREVAAHDREREAVRDPRTTPYSRR
jgi:hypothetical protein